MARTIRTKSRSALPGSGFDASGNPKQGKRRVTGTIVVSSYTASGESLAPADLGLSAIDFISIVHENQAGGAEGSQPRSVRWNTTTSDFYVMDGNTKPAAAASTHNLFFVAEGDALDGVELT